MAEEVEQRLGLLRAEVDALEVFDADFVGGFLAGGAEDQVEVPDAHADLDVIGVGVAIVLGAYGLDGGRLGRLLGLAHRAFVTAGVAG